MVNKNINIKKVVNYWKESSNNDYKTMQNLLESGDYNWALFLGHLVIEKLLKALYVKRNKEYAVFGHDLLRLALKMNLKLKEEQEDWLDTITTFNINARYDNYKRDFYKLCTKNFAVNWSKKIEILRIWLINQL